MTSKERSEFLEENVGSLLGWFCPDCGGDVAEVETRGRLRCRCLFCDRWMLKSEAVWSPGSTISGIDWSRAEVQTMQARIPMIGELVDQVLDRLDIVSAPAGDVTQNTSDPPGSSLTGGGP